MSPQSPRPLKPDILKKLEENPGRNFNLLAIEKKGEIYVFVLTDQTRKATLRLLGDFADRSDLNFDLPEAIALAQSLQAKEYSTVVHGEKVREALQWLLEQYFAKV